MDRFIYRCSGVFDLKIAANIKFITDEIKNAKFEKPKKLKIFSTVDIKL